MVFLFFKNPSLLVVYMKTFTDKMASWIAFTTIQQMYTGTLGYFLPVPTTSGAVQSQEAGFTIFPLGLKH